MRPHIASGALVAIGVAQDQHADRVALYAQWKRLDWPLFLDPLNVLDHRVVPIPIGVDESGLVVMPKMQPDDLAAFRDAAFAPVERPKAPPPHAHAADELFFAGKWTAAIEAYARDADTDPRLRFRLGVAYLRRHESAARVDGDAQRAVASWTAALAAVPNQYIWRRRIQQYGPRLDKPYNMFGWIEEARREIAARGEKPVALAVEPRGTELMGREPAAGEPAAALRLEDKDPAGTIARDEVPLVRVEVVATPPRVRPGRRVRVRLVFAVGDAFWNNEAEPIAIHVAPPDGWRVASGAVGYTVPADAETREERTLEVELETPGGAPPGRHVVKGYALYNVCEKAGGVCLYLRRDFAATVTVDPEAPEIQ